ncbi:hypothetical protein [Citricoccus sp.]|uniref:hypothetical protein n=1 Tax=Citricoccus sp. TaxID=1978372 RepID=UPI0028BE3D20|nr:hypothetical protein [Citricoccus sp.]
MSMDWRDRTDSTAFEEGAARQDLARDAVAKTVFTVEEARASGMTEYQLRHRWLAVPTPGIRLWDLGDLPWREVVEAVSSLPGEHYLSHSTAARLWGLWLPHHLEEDWPIHVTGRKGESGARRRPGIHGHKAGLVDEDVVELSGLRLTTPERTWVDLSTQIKDPVWLVAAGDALLQRSKGPARPDGVLGANPLCTLAEVDAVLGRRHRTKGINAARHARELIREGVDSPAETLLRLIIVDAGLPEPVVNREVWLSPTLKRRPDLHYPQWRIAIQYDGRGHGEAAQLNSDIKRDSDFTDHGWESVKAADDIFRSNGARQFLERLRRAIHRQSRVASTVTVV